MPFGGFKQSGNGRDKSLHAFDKYTELKTTWLRINVWGAVGATGATPVPAHAAPSVAGADSRSRCPAMGGDR